jgi:hypothetical protein
MKVRPALPPIDPNQRYTPEEAALYLRSSRWTVYLDFKLGRLEFFKEGARTYVPGEALIRRSRAPQSSVTETSAA